MFLITRRKHNKDTPTKAVVGLTTALHQINEFIDASSSYVTYVCLL